MAAQTNDSLRSQERRQKSAYSSSKITSRSRARQRVACAFPINHATLWRARLQVGLKPDASRVVKFLLTIRVLRPPIMNPTQRSQAAGAQNDGDTTISRTVPTAVAAVCKHHDSLRILPDIEISVQPHIAHRNCDFRRGFAGGSHNFKWEWRTAYPE